MTRTLDLNSDLGEDCGNDAEIMALVTSANVCCGFHAGSSESAFQALILAAQKGVLVGAHPGFDDREHFGRRELEISPADVLYLCHYQIGALQWHASQVGIPLQYIKPHGALYNQACRDLSLAEPIVEVAESLGLAVMGLPGSQLARASEGRVRFVLEGYADRRYREDGSLVPRSEANAMVSDPLEAADQAERLLRDVQIESLCVHGDSPGAVEFLRALRSELERRGIEIRALT